MFIFGTKKSAKVLLDFLERIEARVWSLQKEIGNVLEAAASKNSVTKTRNAEADRLYEQRYQEAKRLTEERWQQVVQENTELKEMLDRIWSGQAAIEKQLEELNYKLVGLSDRVSVCESSGLYAKRRNDVARQRRKKAVKSPKR